MQKRLDQPCKRRFADPTEPKGGECDAELAGGEVGIQVRADREQDTPAQALRAGELVGLRAAQLDDRELGGDKKPVEQDQQEADERQREGFGGLDRKSVV